MNLRYKKIFIYCYDVKCHNINYYRCWHGALPIGIYKNNFLGLRFGIYNRIIINNPSGIKIEYDHGK